MYVYGGTRARTASPIIINIYYTGTTIGMYSDYISCTWGPRGN